MQHAGAQTVAAGVGAKAAASVRSHVRNCRKSAVRRATPAAQQMEARRQGDLSGKQAHEPALLDIRAHERIEPQRDAHPGRRRLVDELEIVEAAHLRQRPVDARAGEPVAPERRLVGGADQRVPEQQVARSAFRRQGGDEGGARHGKGLHGQEGLAIQSRPRPPAQPYRGVDIRPRLQVHEVR